MKETFIEFKARVKNSHTPRQRKGQHTYNQFHMARPELSADLDPSGPLDPFYQDKNLPAFWE